jgi:VWFA-related protein
MKVESSLLVCRRTALCFAWILIWAGCVYCFQEESPAPDTIIRIDVDLVQLDAVVTNSKGQPVLDLKIEDFTVLQDGKPQEITHFSFVRTKDSKVPETARAKSDAQAPLPALPPPGPIRRERVRRAIALVVDDLGLAFDSTVRVRESVRKWLDNEMQPDDLVAVMRTGGAVGSLQQFSNDKRLLYAAADRLSYNAASRVGVSSFEPADGRRQNSTDAYGFELPMPKKERDLQYTMFSLGSIQYILKGLKDLPGRKSLILFSENLEMMFDDSRGQSQGRDIAMKERIRSLVDLANRAGVVIHSIDPRGLVYTGLTAEDSPGAGSAEVFASRQSQLINSQDALSVLAQQTGGLFISNRNDIARALEEVADDGEGYYLLGFQPDAKIVEEMKKGKPRFHKIRVRVNRPGMRVRSRSEFFSLPDTEMSRDLVTRPAIIEKALLSPFRKEDFRVRLTPLFSQTKDDKPAIHALLHFRGDQLEFTEEPDGWRRAIIEVVAALFSADGERVELAEKKWTIEAKGRTYEYMQKYGIPFLINLPVKATGAYQMRMVLSDTRNGKMGSDTQFVEIPNLREGKLALSGILMAANQQPVEAAVDQAEGVIENPAPNKTAAVRVFEPFDSVTWVYQVLNARTDDNNRPQLQMQVRAFHESRDFFTSKPSPMTAEVQGKSRRMLATDRMRIKNLPPGHYVLQIVVQDQLAKDKQRTAAQSIDFEVQSPDTAK